MNKVMKTIYLLMMLLIVNTCVAFAQSDDKNAQVYNWQTLDIGPAEDYSYALDLNSIKYDRNEDGSINKNIIIYQEKKTNNISMSTEFNYYTITKCKLNIEQTSICFGDESFYTKKDKFRWTDTPLYLTWITVSRDSIGGMRFIQIVEYARAHDDILTSRS
ncbi:hypothetical protein [uncultured Megamonas sp.]|uniref:hypothetical protein n=1 Tax=uncultured Megamonas sp. TaxID=286140 RepID=UPI00266FF4E0|nr:hypothetical protein [uncultured Megamonas sp.]